MFPIRVFMVFIPLTGLFSISLPVATTPVESQSWPIPPCWLLGSCCLLSSPSSIVLTRATVAWWAAAVEVTAVLACVETAWWSISSPWAVITMSSTCTVSSTVMLLLWTARLVSRAWTIMSILSLFTTWLICLMLQVNPHLFITARSDLLHDIWWDWRYASYGWWSRIQIEVDVVADSCSSARALLWHIYSDLHWYLRLHGWS